MSENPYQTPVPTDSTIASGSALNRAPRGLKVICIFCIILGALGLLASLMGLMGLFFQSQLAEFQQTMAAPGQQEMQEKMIEVQSSFFIPNVILALCNLIIGPMLLLGGIGVLSKKGWGQKTLSLALLSAGIFVVSRAIVTSFLQAKVFGIMKESMLDQMPSGPNAGTMETVMIASLYFGLAIGIVMTLALAVFYFWGWRHLKKDSCQAYLSTFSN